ncbi:MAG: hypothetical protein IPP90_21165 [Gemmatimonadaceae bacterium]|nr:hypothetical protein [Gemmatimonadaceae bacterium]
MLALVMDGAISGDGYFVGTPQVDSAARMLTVPDLDFFDVATANAPRSGWRGSRRGIW